MGYHFTKRFFDVLLSGMALIVFSPLFLFVWFKDRTGSQKGPVFFKQVRIGLNGKEFEIYKFRSMIVDADEKLHENKELYEKYLKNNYKLEPHEDPRITEFGSWLRRTSIDEIPQFINVFKGEMSLIGPRPVVKEELKEYGNDVGIFLSVVPGAMGLWQASGRSNVGYPERAKMELYYVQHASLLFDFRILIKNIASIFKGTGAY